MRNLKKWARRGLVASGILALGCGGGLSAAPSQALKEQAVRPLNGSYLMQQNLAPGSKGTPQRRRYCAEWQCAFAGADQQSWCLQSCTYDWDL
ncbi:hypothetical protein J7643_02665 [bacterium]|nr:hypothetical protein [bacterium]